MRRRLLLMALSLVAPAIVLMALLVRAEYQESRARYEQQLVATTRALGLATDRQIGQGKSILQTLAVSPALASGDLEAFERLAQDAVRGEPGWIVLVNKDRQIINTLQPSGGGAQSVSLPANRWASIRSGQSSVSNLTFGPIAKGQVVAVEMPVIVRGELHGLAYVQRPSAFSSIFTAQNVPPTWTASIVDRDGALIARSRDQDRLVGKKASLDMRRAISRSDDGVIESQTLDGIATLSAFSRSPNSGWTFIVGVPRDELQRASWGSIFMLSLAGSVLLSIGVAVALVFSRDISRAVRGLVSDAKAVAAGGSVEVTPGALREATEVRRALHEAALQLRAREDEERRANDRQRLMINELNHRVKNTLATVQSLARQSLGKPSETPGVEAFNDRLLALARAHDLLTRQVWEAADLADVLAATLEPYGGRASLDGPPVALAPNAALALSMVFHELATNASKYGALSVERGVVAVSWRSDPDLPQRLILHWEERGGPAVSPPSRVGFGSRLIAASVRTELSGAARVDYRPTGLVCVLTLTLPPPESPETAH